MNLVERARRAYAPAHSPLGTARQAEQQVLADATARLRAAAQQPQDFPRLAAALHHNRQLWTRLAADVADDGNGLPAALRAQLFYLAEFTEYQSRRILRGQAEVGVLIDINTAVIRGLSGSGLPMEAS